MLIDCPLGAVSEVGRLLTDAAVAAPDVVLLTHSDTDHMAGLVSLVRTRGAREVRFNFDRPVPSDLSGPSAKSDDLLTDVQVVHRSQGC